MNRRQFLRASAAGFALAGLSSHAAEVLGGKPRRVGLIGSGWYGKCDLFRLMQVAPVDVVALCDVDRRMLAEAADLVAERQTSRQKRSTWC
jgi:predicted homoserine dehydrogenase-like protein